MTKETKAGEPVAFVGPVYQIMWACSGSIAPIIEKHGIKIGDDLYTAPPDTEALRRKLVEIETKRDIAVSTLEKVKADREVAQKALAAQCNETEALRQRNAELLRMLTEQDYEYNRNTNDLIKRHAKQLATQAEQIKVARETLLKFRENNRHKNTLVELALIKLGDQ